MTKLLRYFVLLTIVAIAGLSGCTGDKAPIEALLQTISPQTPTEVAREAFNTYDADVRRNSINQFAAARFGGQPPYLRLYRLLLDDPDSTVRAACCEALGLHGQVEDLPRLIERTKDEAAIVRWQAAKALQKIHGQAAIEPLTNLLKQDQDQDVRQAAAIALGQYPTLAVFNQLVGALDDHSYTVVDAAHQSLRILTGYDFGADGSLWLAYANKDSQDVFEHQRQYYWYPYSKPIGLMDKAQFWKDKPVVHPPQIPRGMTPVANASIASPSDTHPQ